MNTLGFGSSFLLGALHALEPGHGKTFLAAYIVGEKLNFKHLFTMGFSLLVSHFFMLTVVAIVLKFLFQNAGFEGLPHMLEWIGPALVIAFGFFLLLKYYFSERKADGHSHNHDHFKFEKPALTKSAIVGLISGILPCPTAIAPLMLSGIESNFSNALMYLFIYVIGMSLIMIIMILLFYLAKDMLIRKFERFSLKVNPHLLSAILIIGVGVIYLALTFNGHLH